MGEDRAARRGVREGEALVGTGEPHLVHAWDLACADGVQADLGARAWADGAVPAMTSDSVEGDASRGARHGLALTAAMITSFASSSPPARSNREAAVMTDSSVFSPASTAKFGPFKFICSAARPDATLGIMHCSV